MTEEIGRREFIRRGTVAGVIATTGMPHVRTPASPATATTASGETALVAPPPMESAPAARRLDSKEFCLSEYDGVRPSLSFSATTPVSARRWQQRARRRLVERLGGFPATRAPLAAEVLESRDLGTYTREKIVFDTR